MFRLVCDASYRVRSVKNRHQMETVMASSYLIMGVITLFLIWYKKYCHGSSTKLFYLS